MRLLLALAICLLFPPTSASASEKVGFSTDEKNRLYLTFEGPIEAGDTARVRGYVQSERFYFLHSHGLIIDSPGGDVEEAIRLANLVEELGLGVYVMKGGRCASSCFLVFASAPTRVSSSQVIVHRPYFKMDGVDGSLGPAYEEAYRQAFARVKAFLSDRLVPSYLIDLMMSKGSKSGYVLDLDDYLRLGAASPAIAEYQVQACGMPTGRLVDRTEIPAIKACVEEYLRRTRFSSLFGRDASYVQLQLEKIEQLYRDLEASDPGFESKKNELLSTTKSVVDKEDPRHWLDLISESYQRVR